MSAENAWLNASAVPVALISSRSANTSFTVIPKPLRKRVIVAMSAWLGANRSANSRVDRKWWYVGDTGSWLSATNASSASRFLTLSTSDTVRVVAAGVGPRSVVAALSGAARAGGAAPSAMAATDDANTELAIRGRGTDFDIQFLRKDLDL